jgi:hypothetical protein
MTQVLKHTSEENKFNCPSLAIKKLLFLSPEKNGFV